MKLLLACALAVAQPAIAQSSASPAPQPTAATTDPAKLGLMVGVPPAREAQVRFDDGSMWVFPKTRWSFSHFQALMPTALIARGTGPISPLPRGTPLDLARLSMTLPDGRTLPVAEAFDLNFTDGLLILHRGRIVFERYAGALAPEGRHAAFSVTKSFVGTLAELLIHEGRIDPDAPASRYVPELANSGFGKATVRQIADMRTAIDHDETYGAAPGELSDVNRMAFAVGSAPPPTGYSGPATATDFLIGIRGGGPHGGPFVYRTPNTMALQWIVERTSGKTLAQLMAERFWAPMGMEQDANISVDRLGTAFGGGGMSASLRDMARFGEMLRLGGRWNGRQILPAEVVKAVLAPGDPAAFPSGAYPMLAGGSYRSQWWHRPNGQTLALGVHGQMILIDPEAELVIARFASHPLASNRNLHPTSLPAWDAIAAHYRRAPRR
ncbi:MAG: serine hydrolase domain-containing protein [Sphingomonadaceae bacterium]